jgi:hypothetical protein
MNLHISTIVAALGIALAASALMPPASALTIERVLNPRLATVETGNSFKDLFRAGNLALAFEQRKYFVKSNLSDDSNDLVFRLSGYTVKPYIVRWREMRTMFGKRRQGFRNDDIILEHFHSAFGSGEKARTIQVQVVLSPNIALYPDMTHGYASHERLREIFFTENDAPLSIEGVIGSVNALSKPDGFTLRPIAKTLEDVARVQIRIFPMYINGEPVLRERR